MNAQKLLVIDDERDISEFVCEVAREVGLIAIDRRVPTH